jgi:hypothetical protein
MNARPAGVELRLNHSDLTHKEFGAKLRTDVGLSEAIDAAIEKLRKDLRHHLDLSSVTIGENRAELAANLVALMKDPSRDPVVISKKDHSWDSSAPWDTFLLYVLGAGGILKATEHLHLKTNGYEQINIPRVLDSTGDPISPRFDMLALGAHNFGAFGQLAEDLVDDQPETQVLSFLLMTAGRAIGINFGNYLLNGGHEDDDGYEGLISHLVRAGRTTYGPIDYANLTDLQYSVIAPYRQSQHCYWLMQEATLKKISKLKEANGWLNGDPNRVLGGKPFIIDSSVPEDTILFGDFANFLIRYQAQVTFNGSEPLPGGGLGKLLGVTATLKGDGNLADDRAISALTVRE